MAKKTNAKDGYAELTAAITAGEIGSLYIFHGEERYLLERGLENLRQSLCPDGLDSFNYKRYDGAILPDDLDHAIDTLPAFADRTLIEIHDYDIFKNEKRERLLEIFSQLPEYVCVVFVYNTVPYKPDGRQKINSAIVKSACVIEFAIQDQSKLIKWIIRHFQAGGKQISAKDAEYLAFITGGLMAPLSGEIEKTAAYAKEETVTRWDIDAVVTPVLDAVAYKLTDALIRRDYQNAMVILDELLQMKEAPHRLIYVISLKMRELLAARICIENGQGIEILMEMCGIRFPFQAKTLFETARKTTLAECRSAVKACAETAYELNSGSDQESMITELIAKLGNLSVARPRGGGI
ncbi:MAG: DNA polymerase III subunit delta [Oscillospiraceae bacterium]|nr:DNA polymerase III subunit delta [Oscillospiraceae bacterium]